MQFRDNYLLRVVCVLYRIFNKLKAIPSMSPYVLATFLFIDFFSSTNCHLYLTSEDCIALLSQSRIIKKSILTFLHQLAPTLCL